MWEADEQYEPEPSGPEYQMWKNAKERLRDMPCSCGYYSSKIATYCVKCEELLYPIPEDP